MNNNYIKSALLNLLLLIIILLIFILTTGANVSGQDIKLKKRAISSLEFESLMLIS